MEVEQRLGRTEGDLHSLQRRQRRALLQEHVVEASLLHPLAHLRGSSRRLGNQATFAKNEEERMRRRVGSGGGTHLVHDAYTHVGRDDVSRRIHLLGRVRLLCTDDWQSAQMI